MLKTLSQKFWEKVQKDIPTKCWNWKGSIACTGYGRLGSNQTRHYGSAHRISWKLHYGIVPKGFCVCHKCDNRKCVNPQHLFLGTYADNFKDMYRKGRHWHKLTTLNIINIRSLNKLKLLSNRKIAKKFSISHTMVNDIVNRVWWKDPGKYVLQNKLI